MSYFDFVFAARFLDFLAALARARIFFITRRSAADIRMSGTFYRKPCCQIPANVIHSVETCTNAQCSFTKSTMKAF
jgi:hypothetical protein